VATLTGHDSVDPPNPVPDVGSHIVVLDDDKKEEVDAEKILDRERMARAMEITMTIGAS
jgi:hypothetical protein